MEISIRDKKENKLLGRTELTANVSFDKSTPSRKEIREALCASLGVPAEQLVIISVHGSFGTQKAVVSAHTYEAKDGAKLEGRHLLIRDGLAQKEEKKEKAKKAPAKK